MGHNKKWLDTYFKLCFMVCITFNFNALCDAYTVQRQSYTMLHKSNIIFCLILGITFTCYFLTVSEENKDHLWQYFVYALNYPPMYEEIDCCFFIQELS